MFILKTDPYAAHAKAKMVFQKNTCASKQHQHNMHFIVLYEHTFIYLFFVIFKVFRFQCKTVFLSMRDSMATKCTTIWHTKLTKATIVSTRTHASNGLYGRNI